MGGGSASMRAVAALPKRACIPPAARAAGAIPACGAGAAVGRSGNSSLGGVSVTAGSA
jgi:hypothetical protein